MRYIGLLLSALLSLSVAAQEAQPMETSKSFGDYQVYFSVFNSTAIRPDIAQANDLPRANNLALVNISVLPKGATSAKAALVKGVVRDLMSNQRQLDFKEIREGQAVYYLAPFRFEHEEVRHFDISVRPDPDGASYDFSFTRKMYRDDR